MKGIYAFKSILKRHAAYFRKSSSELVYEMVLISCKFIFTYLNFQNLGCCKSVLKVMKIWWNSDNVQFKFS